MNYHPYKDAFLNHWVFFKSIHGPIHMGAEEKAFANTNYDLGLGFLYVDHTEGITLSMDYGVKQGKQGQILRKDNLLEMGEYQLIYRYHYFEGLVFSQLNSAALAEHELPDTPDWLLAYYTQPDCLWMRGEPVFNPFRAPGFPDDLQFSLTGKGFKPEGVWGRFEGRLEQENAFALELLVQPQQQFGVHKGDLLPVILTLLEGEIVMFWNPAFGKLERA